MSPVEIVAGVFLITGAFCCVVGGIGLIRLPAFFERTHAGGVVDTMGAGLLLVGMMIYTGGMDLPAWVAEGDGLKYRVMVLIKLVSIAALLLVTSPIAGHALAKAAYEKGVGGPDAPAFEGVEIIPEDDDGEVSA